MLKPIVGAISLLSRIPVGSISIKEPDIKRSVMHFPLVGMLAFLLFYLSYTALTALRVDSYLVILLSLAVTYYFFNLFHFDGFLDSIDGLLSQKSRDVLLEIMKKGNTGPYGIFFGVVYILIKIYLLQRIAVINLLAMFVLSKWGLSFACVAGRPVHNEGLGAIVLGAKYYYLLIATLYLIVLPFLCKIDMLFIILSAASLIVVDSVVIIICTKKINGITGDILGFINEINELFVLSILYIT